METKESHRNKLLIDSSRQFLFGFELAILGLFFMAVCLLLFFVPAFQFWSETEDATQWVLDALVRIVILKWPLAIVAFLFTWAVGVVMSNRLAGPMFRIRQVVEAWKSGDYKSRFVFRKHDYVMPIMQPLNDLLDEQEVVIVKAQELVQEIQNTSGDPKVLEKTRELLKVLYKK